jgi:hypothetical protein
LSEVSEGKSVAQPTNPKVLFGPDSLNNASHTFAVKDTPLPVVAYNLGPDDTLILQHVGGDGGQFYQDVYQAGTLIQITSGQTCLYVTVPGRYRLRYDGQTPLGAFYVEISS